MESRTEVEAPGLWIITSVQPAGVMASMESFDWVWS